jgi:hypothetical protein
MLIFKQQHIGLITHTLNHYCLKVIHVIFSFKTGTKEAVLTYLTKQRSSVERHSASIIVFISGLFNVAVSTRHCTE